MKKKLLYLGLFLFFSVAIGHDIFIANKTNHVILAANEDQKASALKPESGQWYMAIRLIEPKNDYKKIFAADFKEAKIATRKGVYTIKYLPLNKTDAGINLYEELPNQQKRTISKLPPNIKKVIIIINPDDSVLINDYTKVK